MVNYSLVNFHSFAKKKTWKIKHCRALAPGCNIPVSVRGFIVGIRYATYLVSFIHQGIIEVDKTDSNPDDI